MDRAAIPPEKDMYLPPHFAEQRPAVLHRFILQHPFAALVTSTPEGPIGSHLPLVLQEQIGELGALHGHFSKGNQHSKLAPGTAALAIFGGPQAYVTPSWYPSKHETGRVVPTWNFIVVHANGRLTLRPDESFLARHLDDLTVAHEQGRATPWKVADAPPDYVRAAMKGIVGFEILITSMQGKWKLSQNRPDADREAVARGLEGEGRTEMADAMRRSIISET